MRSEAVWVCLCVFGTVSVAQLNDLFEGDICKQDRSALWTCKKIRNCRKAGEALRKGQNPERCSSEVKNTIACCEPDVRPPPRGEKSKNMCKEYAKSVFIQVPDPFGDGSLALDSCAVVEPLISGGKLSGPREFPHMALIGYGSKDDPEWLCGGSLVSKRFILSSAHCTDISGRGLAKWVLLGDLNIRSTEDDNDGSAQPEKYEIIDRINHPDFKLPSVYNDLALFKLDKDVQLNEYIRPACLQTDHQFAKTYAIASGWTRSKLDVLSDIPRKFNLTITPRKLCGDKIQNTAGEKLPQSVNDSTMLCVADKIGGKSICKGDSGAPLQLRMREPYCMYSLVGVTSFGNTCEHDTPIIYTRVSHFVPWIESVVWP